MCLNEYSSLKKVYKKPLVSSLFECEVKKVSLVCLENKVSQLFCKKNKVCDRLDKNLALIGSRPHFILQSLRDLTFSFDFYT